MKNTNFLALRMSVNGLKSLYQCKALSVSVNKKTKQKQNTKTKTKNDKKKKKIWDTSSYGLTNHLGVDQMLVLRVCCIQLYKIF